MPMMIVDDNIFEKELGNNKTVPSNDTGPSDQNNSESENGTIQSVPSDNLESESEKTVPYDNVIRRPFHGRKPKDTNVPEVIQEIIADDNGTTHKDLQEKFGVSQSSISAYRNGATSTTTYEKPNDRLATVVKKRRERITNRSTKAMMRILNHIDDDSFEEKLESCKATELSIIASNMSRVVEKVSVNHHEDAAKNQTNIIFYAPTPLKSDPFEVIDLGRKHIDQS